MARTWASAVPFGVCAAAGPFQLQRYGLRLPLLLPSLAALRRSARAASGPAPCQAVLQHSQVLLMACVFQVAF
jgi:hypothetical protein